jgi:hypothetical protein
MDSATFFINNYDNMVVLWRHGLVVSSPLATEAGWPDEFVEKNAQILDQNFFKTNT